MYNREQKGNTKTLRLRQHSFIFDYKCKALCQEVVPDPGNTPLEPLEQEVPRSGHPGEGQHGLPGQHPWVPYLLEGNRPAVGTYCNNGAASCAKWQRGVQ